MNNTLINPNPSELVIEEVEMLFPDYSRRLTVAINSDPTIQLARYAAVASGIRWRHALDVARGEAPAELPYALAEWIGTINAIVWAA